MNVEHSPAAAPQGRSVGSAHAKNSKAPASAASTDAAGEGGFVSLLALLSGDDGLELQDAALMAADGAVGAGAASTNDLPAAALPADGAGAAAMPSGNVAAPDGAAAMPLWASAEQMLQGRPAADGALPAAEGIQVAGLEAPRPGEEGAALAARGLPPRAASPADNGLKMGQDDALRELPGPLGRAVSEQMQAQVASKRLASQAAANAAGAALSNSGGDTATRAKVQMDGARAEMSNPVAVATEQAFTSTLASPATAERRGDKVNESGARFIGDVGWSRPALAPGNGAEVSAASAGASVGDPGRQVAEQVSYWIANDVQNAEFKLDRFGDSPVEVSISLQGKEARVEFRTDFPEMRQVLQDAVTQLKDMLQSQGLVLTGVSVGGSGADASGQQEQPAARQNVRQATVAAAPAALPVGGAGRMAEGVGRSLDVFV